MDLMYEQSAQGHEVALLWPGQMGFINNKLSIRKSKKNGEITSFEIINPLPVPLDEGIKDFEAYTRKCDTSIYKKFLQEYNPQAIHIHSLMGLHKEFLMVAEEMNIKTIFTTHDYFGLCPTVTFFCNNRNYIDDYECKYCVLCNQSALSINKIKVMQSPIYRKLKETTVVKFFRRKHRKTFFNDNLEDIEYSSMSKEEIEMKAKLYKELQQYYIDMYEMIDIIHFNSSVAEEVYKKYIRPKDYRRISITHKGISDKRIIKAYSGKLKITYLAPAKPFKGFDFLKSALDELWEEGYQDFELKIYSLTNKISPYMNVSDGYQYTDLENIFAETDVLVAPSVWHETFGFTVLEALSFGVPVLVSDNVGSKDIVGKYAGWIIKSQDVKQFKKKIKEISHEDLKKCNQFICSNIIVPKYSEFVTNVINLYE